MLRIFYCSVLFISVLLPIFIHAQSLPDPTFNTLLKQFNLPAFSRYVFVDPKLATSCDDYQPTTRKCGQGNSLAINQLSAADNMARAGDLFLLREGRFKQVLHVTKSGNARAYIGFSAYKNEKVILYNVNSIDHGEEYGAIWLDEVSYIVVNGISVDKSIGFGRFLNAHHNIFSNNKFTGSSIYNGGRGASKRGGLYVAFSHHNQIVNNLFQKGTDLLSLVHANYNRVQGNTMNLAGHDVWNIKCGSFNVIRDNTFSNIKQKLGAVFDCEQATMNWHGNGRFRQQSAVLDASQYNLIEHNVFKDAVRYYSASGGNGIQYAGQHGLIRFNTFYHTNVGFSLASYRPEATYNYSNRIYHNTFHDNWCVGIAIGSEIEKFTDNQFINNILWNNQGLGASQCNDNNAKQVLFRQKEGDEWFVNNNIGSDLGDLVIGLWGNSREMSVYDFEGSFIPVRFKDTLASDPLFVNQKLHDYRLSMHSPMVDTGLHLSKIISAAGKADSFQVQDSQFFYDGAGIANETGDQIMVRSASIATKKPQLATIVKIDRLSNKIYLDKQISWGKGDLISLVYNGLAPDVGAFESK